jgi:cardiolipin synthase
VPADAGDEEVLIVTSGPSDRLEAAKLMYIHAINSASQRIWIASPYYVPDEAVIAALQLAGLRGVDVRILIPELSDHRIVNLAAWSYFADAGLTGVKFYRYQDGFMHRKAMLIDDVAAAVGSANFDNRSFRLNFEITGLFMSPQMIGDVERMFEQDFARSRRIDPDILETRPFWFRLAVSASRILAPLL